MNDCVCVCKVRLEVRVCPEIRVCLHTKLSVAMGVRVSVIFTPLSSRYLLLCVYVCLRMLTVLNDYNYIRQLFYC